MKFFGRYLRQHRLAILLFILSWGLLAASFALYGLPLAAVAYPALLSLLLCLAAAVWDYTRTLRRHRKLSELRTAANAQLMDLPEPASIGEADCMAAIAALRRAAAERETADAARYREMVDYYTAWVHQIKTPIAAMRLTLQPDDTPNARRLMSQLLRIEQYVDMVLMYLRLDEGTSDYVIRACDLDGIIRQSLRKFAGEFIDRKLTLHYEPLHLSVVTDEKWLGFVVEQVLSNALTGTELTLSGDEVYVYGHRMTYTAPQFTVGDTTWRVKSLLDRCAVNGAAAADVTPSLYVVVPDFESAARLLLDLSANSDLSVQLRWYYQFDSDLPDDAQHSGSASYGTDGVPASLTDALQLALYNVNAETDLTTGWEVESLAANRSDFYGAYGGLFFLGIMLSVVFSLAAVSIIYYKQVCEGYEDQSRFAIMQKVGMTKQDIRRSINSQLLTVFFLPMALSGVHLCFAFPFIHKLLLLFNLSNTSLLIGTTVVCYVAFALPYTLAYKLTSNAYYHIVSGAAERE